MRVPIESDNQSSYRRGTVMGLTAAEAFMLIAFILLTLLVLWRVTENEEKVRLVEENIELQEMVGRLGSEDAVQEAIAFQQRFEEIHPDIMEERLEMLADETLMALVDDIKALPNDGRRELTDMIRSDAFPGAREKLDAFVELGVTPEEIREMRAALDLIEAQSGTSARTGAEIAARISESAGDRIAALGGRILPDGDVIFPDAVLFDAGQAEIRPEFDVLLQSFCRIWFETLYEQRGALDTVQVEGHASSEFGNLGPEQAFVVNLDLSQRRAAAVFGRCLTYGGKDEVTDWARSAMAAIGYSSSRLVLEGNEENRTASRRVVFAIEPKTETEMAASLLYDRELNSQRDQTQIDPDHRNEDLSALQQHEINFIPDENYYKNLGFQQFLGRVTRVRDGDTIVVGDQPIRLNGLHAPETNTNKGRESSALMSELALDKDAACWLSGRRTFDRLEGVCFVEGRDIGAAIVSAGLGRDCPAFSDGRYADIELTQARLAMELPGYCLRN